MVKVSYSCLSEFFIENDLFSSKQPGFEEGDLCINQLLSISHEIYNPWIMDIKIEVFSFIYQRRLIKFTAMEPFMN